jgi:hypothetical protein
MTIEQTVEIPADHRLTLEIPREIPAGTTRVLIQFPDESPEAGDSLNEEIERRLGRPPADEAERAKWAQWLETMRGIRRAYGAWAANPWENALEDIRADRDACEATDPWRDVPPATDKVRRE